jgi:hypothetical protein
MKPMISWKNQVELGCSDSDRESENQRCIRSLDVANKKSGKTEPIFRFISLIKRRCVLIDHHAAIPAHIPIPFVARCEQRCGGGFLANVVQLIERARLNLTICALQLPAPDHF